MSRRISSAPEAKALDRAVASDAVEAVQRGCVEALGERCLGDATAQRRLDLVEWERTAEDPGGEGGSGRRLAAGRAGRAR